MSQTTHTETQIRNHLVKYDALPTHESIRNVFYHNVNALIRKVFQIMQNRRSRNPPFLTALEVIRNLISQPPHSYPTAWPRGTTPISDKLRNIPEPHTPSGKREYSFGENAVDGVIPRKSRPPIRYQGPTKQIQDPHICK